MIHHGTPTRVERRRGLVLEPEERRPPASADGTLAPAMVSQKTTARSPSMSGSPRALRGHEAIDALIELERAGARCLRTARRVMRSTSP